MAAFDSKQSQIVTRIVYDGPGGAGKTSNLVALQHIFTPTRRSELTTPETTQGRTLYFDHMILEGGLIAGHRFRCELWTVPGQDVLRRRREFLLHRADVVVMVVDCRPSGVEHAKQRLEELYQYTAGRTLPLVLQANRQDEPTALAPAEVREALKLPEETPTVAAVASEGNGVRETALWAMRSAAMALQPFVIEHGPEGLGDEVEDPTAALHRMRKLPLLVPPAHAYASDPTVGEETLTAWYTEEAHLPDGGRTGTEAKADPGERIAASQAVVSYPAAVRAVEGGVRDREPLPEEATAPALDIEPAPFVAERVAAEAPESTSALVHDSEHDGLEVAALAGDAGAGAVEAVSVAPTRASDTQAGGADDEADTQAAHAPIASVAVGDVQEEEASSADPHGETPAEAVGEPQSAAEHDRSEVGDDDEELPLELEDIDITFEDEGWQDDPLGAAESDEHGSASAQPASIPFREGGAASRMPGSTSAPPAGFGAGPAAEVPPGSSAAPRLARSASAKPTPLPPPPPPCGATQGAGTAAASVPTPAPDSSTAHSRIPLEGLNTARFPNSEVPSFHIWPPSSGRETLRLVPYERAVLRTDLQQSRGKGNGSGKFETHVYRAGNWCLKTSTRRCYPVAELAREQLVHLARRKVALEEHLPPSTVLVLQESEVGYWLWTVTPWFRSLRFEMAQAEAIHSEEALGAGLRRYAHASVRALSLVRTRQLALDVHPSNFAYVDGQMVYLDDDIDRSSTLPTIGYAWLMRVEEYGGAVDALEQYVSELEKAILRHLTRTDVEALGLEAAIDETLVQSDLGRRARDRLVQAVRGCGSQSESSSG